VTTNADSASEGRHYSRHQRAHILGLNYARPDPEQPRMSGRKASPKLTKLMPDRARSVRKRPQISLRSFVV
jgi:hypothetical protein